MAITIQNVSGQSLPIILPQGSQKNIKARETVILALDKPTKQMLSLKERQLLKIK